MVKVTIDINTAELEQTVDALVAENLDTMGHRAQSLIQDNVPVITGQLLGSVVIGPQTETETGRQIVVGCDESIAYYAPYVYYPGVTRNYAGNQFIDRAAQQLASEGDAILEKLDHDIPDEYKSENVKGKHKTITK